MKKAESLRKCVTVIIVSCLFLTLSTVLGCKQKAPSTGGGDTQSNIPRTGRVKVKPHNDPKRSNTYCLYAVTAPLPTPSLFKVNDLICVYCPSGKNGCDNFSEVEMYEGTVYNVSPRTNGLSCTTCPAGTDSAPGFSFEEQ